MSLRAIASSFQSVNYQGTWDASTNNPALTSSVGTKGYYYVVSVAGSTNLNGITNWGVGDWAVFNGSVWQRVEGGADGNFVNLSVSGTAVISDNSASAALRITQIGAGNALLVEDSANPDATPFVINNSGAALVGVDATRTLFTAYTPSLQVEGTTSSTFSQSITANINTAASPVMFFAKSRGTTNGSNDIVSLNDTLGVISFNGADGTDIQSTAAQIFAAVDGTPGANDMPGRLVFSTTPDGAVSSTERMRIDSAGRVGIGAAAGTDTVFGIYGNARSTSATNFGVRSFVTVPSTNTTRFTAFESNSVTQAASFTLTNYRHFVAAQDSIGAGSSIASQFGFYAENNLTGATNNYGFFSNIASGTGRWNFYAAGTADNYFAGNVGIGTTTTSGKLNVTGGTIEFDPGNGADSTRAFNFNITGTNFGKILIPVGSGGAMAFWTGSPAAERMRIGSTGIISLGAAVGSESLRVTPVASAVNYLEVTGAITTAAPSLIATGSDTNIDLKLTPKGTGVVQYGTYTAGVVAQTGYITIKDAGGTTRRLLVG